MSEKIAQLLQNERMQRNISLDDLAKKTHISKRFLIYLEEGRFEKLPGKFYLRKYLAAYLQALEISPEDFFKHYQQEMKSIFGEEKNLQSIADRIRYEKFRARNHWLKLIALFLFILALVLLFFYVRDNANWRKFFVHPPKAFPQSKTAFLKPEDRSEYDYNRIKVALKFNQDCWLSLEVDRRKIAEKLFKAGEQISASGSEFVLVVGKPEGVKLELNDLPLPRFSALKNAVKMRINSKTLLKILREYADQ